MTEPGLACCTPLTGTPMSAAQAEQVAPLLKALADPVRLRLVSLIAASAGGEACVCDLNDAFDLTQATDQPPPQGAALGRRCSTATSAACGSTTPSARPRSTSVATLFDTAALTPA